MTELFLPLIVLGLAACARPIAPDGGLKDSTPPKVVPESSTPNLSTNFTARSFELTFDEWVTLQDVGAQVLVSPPLAKRPEVTLKGRTVTFKFDAEEVLRPNTTYTVNFGTAVKDLHESNPAQDLRFVFSTGDAIDSLTVSGLVVDAFSGELLENITVMLYDIFEDSVVSKERPYYMARTDKSGQYRIQNVRAGTFKCVAIDDKLPGLKWDADERIGFPDSLIVVSDSLPALPANRLFTPQPPMRLLPPNTGTYGLVKLPYTRSPDSIRLTPELPGLRWVREQEQDTLLLWYDSPESTAWSLLAGADTVSVPALSRERFLSTNKVQWGDERSAAPSARAKRINTAQPATAAPPPRTIIVNASRPVQLPFNNPVAQIDTTRCLLIADSVETRQFDIRPDSAKPREMLLDIPWNPESKYELYLLPGALTDFYGTANSDTLRRNFNVPADKQLGALSLSLEDLQPGQTYVLRLMSSNTAVEQERSFRADSTVVKFRFEKLQPIAFTLQLVEDRNGNGRWDPGDYYARRQPEQVFIRKLEALRANWEVEAILQAKTGAGKRGKE